MIYKCETGIVSLWYILASIMIYLGKVILNAENVQFIISYDYIKERAMNQPWTQYDQK